jgi:hypothetical protein
MKALLFGIITFTSTAVSTTPVLVPPERKIHITRTGDVLEWQPGLGIVVLSSRTVTHVSRTGDGKTLLPLERTVVEPTVVPAKRIKRARPEDDGETLMEEMRRVN